MSNIDRAERRRLGVSNHATRWDYMDEACSATPWIKRQRPEVQRPYLFTPDLPFTLYGPADCVTSAATLDSGAQFSAFPQEWAEGLGCDLSRAERIQAHGNGVLADYFVPVEPLRLEVAGQMIELEHPTFGPWLGGVLGRGDVFRHFLVIFDERAQQFVLDPYDSE